MCDTAKGNATSALGLSGIGLTTGIDKAVGSLWAVSDRDSVGFMLNFYQ